MIWSKEDDQVHCGRGCYLIDELGNNILKKLFVHWYDDENGLLCVHADKHCNPERQGDGKFCVQWEITEKIYGMSNKIIYNVGGKLTWFPARCGRMDCEICNTKGSEIDAG